MRHVSFLSLPHSVPVLPFTMEHFALTGALISAACLLEAFLPSDDCAVGTRAVPPSPVALSAHDLRGAAQLAVEQSS